MIGQRLAHFEITDKLGSGGMGDVYRATDTKLRRPVAIKVLPRQFSASEERLVRFQREARLLASLNHPNIAGIYEVGEHTEAEGPLHFLAMELVEGEELTDQIARGALPLEDALGIARQVARALEQAHNQGVVHRDLKPANVKITPDGSVKVLDFGLAKAFGIGEESDDAPALSLSPTLTQATEAGVILGTAAYMSPEQAKGKPVDRRADIWAFGAVLYEMLTGRRTFRADTVSETLAAVLLTEIDWRRLPPETPYAIRRLLERCLERDPGQRLQAIGEARVAIESYLADPASAEVAIMSGGARSPLWLRLLPWALAAAAAVVAGVTILAPRSSPTEARPARFSVQVTSGTDLQRGYGTPAVVSRSGKWLAFVDRGFDLLDANGLTLHLRPFDRLEDRVIDDPERAGHYHPFFSPDEEWIGFVTQSELKKASVRGGTPTTLAPVNRNRGSTWGPDGSIIYAPTPAGPLYRIAASGEGEPVQLTSLLEGELTHRWPQFLPGGRAIVFTVHTSTSNFSEAWIESLDLTSGKRQVIVRGGSYPRYAPSGHLLFARSGTLYALPYDPERLERRGDPVPVLEGVGWSDLQGGAHYDFSETGLLLYGADPRGEDLRPSFFWGSERGLDPVPGVESEIYSDPSLSPDGRRLAVAVGLAGELDVWILDLERGAKSRLTFGATVDAAPVWSPDGRQIAFASDRDGGATMNLYSKAADGAGEVTKLTESQNTQFPSAWSSDGRYLLFFESTPDRNWDLRVLDLETGAIQDLAATAAPERSGDFSPDGRWVAYTVGPGAENVFVQPFPGPGGRWQISTNGGEFPRWSPTGDRIYYRTQEALMVVDVEAQGDGLRVGIPEVAVPALGPVLYRVRRDYAISPVDDRILVLDIPRDELEGESAYSHMTLVLNWFDELRKLAGGS